MSDTWVYEKLRKIRSKSLKRRGNLRKLDANSKLILMYTYLLHGAEYFLRS
jgi:hypothetical protein